MNMNSLPVDDSPAPWKTATSFSGICCCNSSKLRRGPEGIAIYAKDQSVTRFTQPRGIFRDYIQHWLDVCRRACDYAQDFTRRRLLFQRFLEFLEQPNILDGDNRLIGESFK